MTTHLYNICLHDPGMSNPSMPIRCTEPTATAFRPKEGSITFRFIKYQASANTWGYYAV